MSGISETMTAHEPEPDRCTICGKLNKYARAVRGIGIVQACSAEHLEEVIAGLVASRTA